MSLDLYINPVTGGYEEIDGKITLVQTAINKANVLLSQPIGSYIYAPEQGNPLLDIQGIISLQEIKDGITTCLESLVQNGDITTVDIINWQYDEVTQRYTINIKLTLPSGEQPLLTWIK